MPGYIHICQNIPLSPKGPGKILGGGSIGDGGNQNRHIFYVLHENKCLPKH